MAKAAIDICAILLCDEFAGQERQGDLAPFGVWRNERGDITLDGGFADCVTRVHTLHQGYVNAIELHLQLVVAQGENAKLTFVEAINAVELSRSDDLISSPRLRRSCALWLVRGGCPT